MWLREQRIRDTWIRENRQKYFASARSVRELQILWAKENRVTDLSFKPAVDNFIGKLKGQIEKKEALTGNSTLHFLDGYMEYVPGNPGNPIFDFNVEAFKDYAKKLIQQYY